MVSCLSLPRRRVRQDGVPINHLRASGGDREQDYDHGSGLGKAHVSCGWVRPPRGKMLSPKMLRRGQVRAYFANLAVCVVGMEGCAGAHFLGARAAGTVPRGPAESCAAREGVRARGKVPLQRRVGDCRGSGVPVKTLEQQEVQALYRMRAARVKEGTRCATRIAVCWPSTGL